LIYAMVGALLGALCGVLVYAVLVSGTRRRARPLMATGSTLADVQQQPELLPFELDRGLVAYESYRRGCAGIAPESRAPLPDWKELHPDIQLVWVQVGNDVCSRYGAIY
jgi:hypothetical protein